MADEKGLGISASMFLSFQNVSIHPPPK
jgi:hypothetical protein